MGGKNTLVCGMRGKDEECKSRFLYYSCTISEALLEVIYDRKSRNTITSNVRNRLEELLPMYEVFLQVSVHAIDSPIDFKKELHPSQLHCLPAPIFQT